MKSDGKIPWTTAVRNLGEEEALALVKEGKVAPSPEMAKLGEAYPWVEAAKEALATVAAQMNEAGVPGKFRVSYFN